MKKLLVGAALLGMLALPNVVEAQVEISPHAGIASDVDFGVGGGVSFPLTSLHEMVEGSASFSLFFPDGFDYWEINALLRYLIELSNPDILPYVTAGIGYGNFSFDLGGITIPGFDASASELALRVGGGAKFNAGEAIVPFGEVLFSLGDLPDFVLRGGVSFTVGG